LPKRLAITTTTAHACFDPNSQQLFSVNYGKSIPTALAPLLHTDGDTLWSGLEHFITQLEAILRPIAKVLVWSVDRETDLTARYGGEEFVLLLPNTHLVGAERVVARAKQNVAALQIEHARSQVKPHISISLGYAALIPSPEDDPTNLLAHADAALYLAKHQGRDRYYGLALEDLGNP
jgi:hypothetical protein